ncbi:MAG: hypothetical protein ACEQSK_06465 [Sphingomonadaceae bacterium]
MSLTLPGYLRCGCLLAAIILTCWSGPVAALDGAAALPTMVLISTDDTDRSQGNWLRLIYGEALRRMGYQLEYRSYPAKRASVLAESGVVDGEVHRATDYSRFHPDLVQVATSHYSVTFAAYGLAPLTLADGWAGLAQSGVRVEYRAGIAHCETVLPPLISAARLSTVNSVTLGLRKLLRHRTDVFIDVDRVVDTVLAEPEFQGSGIVRLANMDVTGAYAFLHQRNAALAPKLAQVLADMRREGVIERYLQQPAAPAVTPAPERADQSVR